MSLVPFFLYDGPLKKRGASDVSLAALQCEIFISVPVLSVPTRHLGRTRAEKRAKINSMEIKSCGLAREFHQQHHIKKRSDDAEGEKA